MRDDREKLQDILEAIDRLYFAIATMTILLKLYELFMPQEI